jgi:CheY-like chemotaxis protein
VRIIITDDHPRFRALLRSLLADVAAEFIECANGAEAVTAYHQHRPDWLLIDLRMPVMDGLSAVRAIKTGDPTARVIVVTNHGDAALRQQAAQLGVEQFILKEDLSLLRDLVKLPHPQAVASPQSPADSTRKIVRRSDQTSLHDSQT